MSLRTAAILFAWAFSAAAHAQSTATSTVQVSAEVLSVCRFATAPTLNFGPLDPANPVDKVVKGTLKFNCSAGTLIGAEISTGGGPLQGLTGSARMTRAGGADVLGYGLTLNGRAFTGGGFNASGDLSLELTASLPSSAYTGATTGIYQDTVTITWNY